MIELVEALDKRLDDHEGISELEPDFHRAAIRWNDQAMRTYRGALLKKALVIGAAMVDFIAELEGQR